MDAGPALEELSALSSQVVEAVVVEADGSVVGPSAIDIERAGTLGVAGIRLLADAARLRPGGPAVERIEVALQRGAIYALHEGGRTVVATTGPGSVSGLVLYDLRTVLRRSAEEASPERRTRSGLIASDDA